MTPADDSSAASIALRAATRAEGSVSRTSNGGIPPLLLRATGGDHLGARSPEPALGGTAMFEAGDQIDNPVTGERLVFHETAAGTNGERVVVETTVQPGGFVAAAHVHPFQTE